MINITRANLTPYIDKYLTDAGAIVAANLPRTACGWGLVEDVGLADWIRGEFRSLAVSLAAPILERL